MTISFLQGPEYTLTKSLAKVLFVEILHCSLKVAVDTSSRRSREIRELAFVNIRDKMVNDQIICPHRCFALIDKILRCFESY
jgi:hypothetical protein